MEIIAHRGFVSGPTKPHKDQLIEALNLGFGIEFDVRDSADDVVIAHDPWEVGTDTLGSLLKRVPFAGTLAINIKSCGLAPRIKQGLADHQIEPTRCFFFDMAVPDHLAYQKLGLRAYPRISEIEPFGVLAQKSEGIWLDAFHSTWWQPESLAGWLQQGMSVCVVSPDLHRREYLETWHQIRRSGLAGAAGLSICTDFALEARDFFNR